MNSSNSFSFHPDDETLQKMLQFYEYCQIESKNPHVLLCGSTPEFTIQIYKNGNVLIQGKQAIYEYSIWQKEETFIEHAGSDEVGTGDYFGPIVVAACIVKKEDIAFLTSLGVKDSKMLSDNKIMEIAPKIMQRIKLKISILSNTKYNQLYSTEHYNLNKIKAYLHNFVLYKLIEDNHFEGPVIIDQFCDSNLYYQYLVDFKAHDVLKNVSFYIKAENKFLAVACASIVARYEFLKRLQIISKEVGMPILKGASTEVDQLAYKIAYKNGLDCLKKYTKFHFANTKRIIKLLEYKTN